MKYINHIIFIFYLFSTGLSHAQGDLHQAVFEERLDLVQALIKKEGTDVNKVDSQGLTPLHWAMYHDNEGIIELLLNSGANINAAGAKPNSGFTPLHVAALNGHEKIVLLLLQRGATLHATDRDSLTPLNLAKRHGHTKVAMLLQSWPDNEKKKQENSKKHQFSNRFLFQFKSARFLNNTWLQKGAITTIFAGLIILGYQLLFKRRYQPLKQKYHLFKRR